MKKERINENSGGSAYEAVVVVEVEDRDRVVEAGGGLTGDCWLTTTSVSSVLAKCSGGYST